ALVRVALPRQLDRQDRPAAVPAAGRGPVRAAADLPGHRRLRPAAGRGRGVRQAAGRRRGAGAAAPAGRTDPRLRQHVHRQPELPSRGGGDRRRATGRPAPRRAGSCAVTSGAPSGTGTAGTGTAGTGTAGTGTAGTGTAGTGTASEHRSEERNRRGGTVEAQTERGAGPRGR